MEQRVTFTEITEQYPDNYVALRDVKDEKDGGSSGVIVQVCDSYEEAAKALEILKQSVPTAIFDGYNILAS